MITSEELAADLAGCAAAHARLLQTVGGLTDADVRRDSRLPGWTVGHVLNHLRRNAEGLTTMARAAARGEVGDQYTSADGRREGIEDGAAAPAAELVQVLGGAIGELDAAFAALGPQQWTAGRGRTLRGEIPITELPWRRWREVDVHHADLGLAYTYDDWPDAFVRRELPGFVTIWKSRRPMGLTELPEPVLALSPPRRLAWMLGRLEVEGVEPAEVYS
jgi:maleylpyruvate isomerase